MMMINIPNIPFNHKTTSWWNYINTVCLYYTCFTPNAQVNFTHKHSQKFCTTNEWCNCLYLLVYIGKDPLSFSLSVKFSLKPMEALLSRYLWIMWIKRKQINILKYNKKENGKTKQKLYFFLLTRMENKNTLLWLPPFKKVNISIRFANS